MNAVSILRTPEKLGLRVVDYLRLARDGAFADHRKTELIEGDVFAMNAQFSRHARVKTRLAAAFNQALALVSSDLEALVEVSIRLSDDTMPEPDITLTRYQGDDPAPADSVALIVEVSDTTLAIDLGRKAGLYARHGVPEYWVVDVEAHAIHVMSAPTPTGYAAVRQIAFGEIAPSATIAGLKVPTATM